MAGTVLALGGLCAVTVAWLHYLWLIPRERVPRRPVGHTAAMVAGVLASVGAEMLAPGVAAHVCLGVGAALAAFFVYLWTWAPQPPGQPTFAIGQPLPALTATSADGVPWSSAELAGSRILVKLFRGHW